MENDLIDTGLRNEYLNEISTLWSLQLLDTIALDLYAYKF